MPPSGYVQYFTVYTDTFGAIITQIKWLFLERNIASPINIIYRCIVKYHQKIIEFDVTIISKNMNEYTVPCLQLAMN